MMSCMRDVRGLYQQHFAFYHKKQINSMLPWVCKVTHHRKRQDVIRISVCDTLGCALCATILFLPLFDIICDQLLNRSRIYK